MTELPKGWATSPLGELLSIQSGFAFKSTEYRPSGHFLIRIGNVQDGRVSRDKPQFVELDARTKAFELAAGDILTSLTGNIGRVARIQNKHLPAALNQRVARLKPTKALQFDGYLYAFLTSPSFRTELALHGKGGAQQNVSPATIGELKIPLPPLPEQRRIVRKLVTLTARTTTARTHLSAIEKLVERYKAGVLDQVFSTAENRVALGSLLTGIKAGKNLRCDERPPLPHERGTVKVSAVSWGRFQPDQSKTLPPTFEPDPSSLIRPGDLLFSRANTVELVGAVVIVDVAPKNLFLSDKVLRLDTSDHLKPWILWYLRSGEGRRQLEEVSSGNQMSMRNIGQASLKAVTIPLPDTEERRNALNLIETGFAKIDRLAAEAEKALKLTDRLDQRILAKAFAGKLVPQDPNDEPAETLLARIRAERAVALKPKQGRKKRPPHDLV
ncbi:restriction endonuclease subunit S [Paracoccus saliphilus]|uniref:Restriction endonuclease subunit S n=1 Tax=Paracoccus saliphilus TaxID=405559 RepID=A0AA45W710_9RHOB|nr:restriction endonuclease subunit S [Paracoccus saliphilus]WCR03934.1 restriction endonuclease subunit S [Paracoccus saliphilus]SIT06104.1 type I restriction enzyme, S subunit [Paracoccus saliphilus]